MFFLRTTLHGVRSGILPTELSLEQLEKFQAVNKTNCVTMSESDSSGTATQPTAPQFIQSTIPLPSKLDFKGNLAVNWKKFKRL